MKPLILSIEDDAQMASLLKTLFEISEYPMIQARNGKEALRLFLSEKPDLVLLDLGLPDLDGKEIIRKIREFAQTPILVLSARSEDTDKIEALDLGA
ncbi:response regulator, partial [Dubosiella newyorkensis]